MRRLPYVIAIALFAAPVLAYGKDAEPADARQFIDQVYALFPESPKAPDPGGSVFQALFEPSLDRLIKRDQDTTPPGDVGLLDFDPFCECQDPEGMRHTILSIRGNAAKATVRVLNNFVPPARPNHEVITYRLVAGKNGWQISDIVTARTPSFRAWLVQGLKSQRHS
jgi:hypothetical protein